jgi:hypothetical protein
MANLTSKKQREIETTEYPEGKDRRGEQRLREHSGALSSSPAKCKRECLLRAGLSMDHKVGPWTMAFFHGPTS